MQRTFSAEFVYQLFSLLLSVLLVHAVYVTLVWPNAQAVIEQNRQMVKQDASYTPQRSWVHSGRSSTNRTTLGKKCCA